MVARVGALVAVGRTSDVYEFGADAVVKIPRPGVPAHWPSLEANFTNAVQSLGVRVPSVIEVTEIDGTDAIVFERVGGRTMWEHMVDDPRRIPDLAALLAETQQRIFAAGPADHLRGLTVRIRRKLRDVQQLTRTERAEADAAARALPVGAALLHGDLHPGNVLLADDGPVVIDWFDASIGHPIGDIVRSSILMRPFGDRGDPPHLPGADIETLTLLHDSYVAAMSGLLDETPEQLRSWEALVAASRLSEGAQSDGPALLAIWQGRHRPPNGPLVDAVTRRSDRSPAEAPDR